MPKKLKPLPRKGINHLELKVKHEGRDYIVVIQTTNLKMISAANMGRNGKGVKLNSATLYDMTAFREFSNG